MSVRRISLTALGTEDFEENHLYPGVPVLIEDSLANVRARNWTLTSLERAVGASRVHVRQVGQGYAEGTTYGIELMKFSDYLRPLLDPTPENLELARKHYLAVQNIKSVFPELVDEIDLSQFPLIETVHGGPFLWIAAPGHHEYTHVDADDGMLFVISGSKTIRLYSHKYLHEMYPNRLGSKGRTIQSQVVSTSPNYELYPQYSIVEHTTLVLNAGEALFIPSFYWHQVTSTECCISVNVFWGDKQPTKFIQVTFPPIESDRQKLIETRYPIFEYWLLNIVEQNRFSPNFESLLSVLDRSLRLLLMTQFKDCPSDDQIQILVKSIKNYLGIETLPTPTPEVLARKSGPKFKIRGLLYRKD